MAPYWSSKTGPPSVPKPYLVDEARRGLEERVPSCPTSPKHWLEDRQAETELGIVFQVKAACSQNNRIHQDTPGLIQQESGFGAVRDVAKWRQIGASGASETEFLIASSECGKPIQRSPRDLFRHKMPEYPMVCGFIRPKSQLRLVRSRYWHAWRLR